MAKRNDTEPEETLVAVGCADCMAQCPYTNETNPPLTEELGEQWYQEHLRVCPRKEDRNDGG